MSITIDLDYEQVEKIVDQLDINKKAQLLKHISMQTYRYRLEEFIKSKANIPLSFEEITKEVEKERTERFNARHS